MAVGLQAGPTQAGPTQAGPAMVALLLAGTCLAAGCAEDRDAARLLDSGPASGYRSDAPPPWVLTFGAETPWLAFFREHASNRPAQDGGPPPAPDVRFAEEAVVAVVLGERPTTGYRLEVDVDVRAGRLHVDVRETQPGAGCVTLPAIQAPFELIAVPREGLASLEPRVSVQQRTEDCAA